MKVKKKSTKWRVVVGYDEAGEVLAYYVVRGMGTNQKQLEFDHHGAYILQSAAQETCDVFNLNPNLYAEIMTRYVGATLKKVATV